MKFITIFLFAAGLQVSATGYSQKITLLQNNVSLKKVFREIERQTGYNFFYKDKLLRQAENISINVNNASVEAVLNECFKNQPLVYSILDKIIVVKAKNIIPLAKPEVVLPPIVSIISGAVKDEQGNPLAGVSVIVKGTTKGTSTAADGNFSIEANTGDVLEFSIVGYKNKFITVGQTTNMNVVMEIEVTVGSEVIIVGYGTQKRQNLTAAVSTVNLDNIDSKPITDLGQALAGMAAGATAVQSSSQPGSSGSSIRIRGDKTLGDANNTPLVVIDGTVGGSLEDISPYDVASISILKDASSTAMYGARAAAGVILVTTKRGVVGNVKIRYDSYAGYDKVAKLPNTISNSATYMELLRDWTHSSVLPSDSVIAAFKNAGESDPINHPNTDWYQLVMGDKAMLQSHNISLRGGSDKARVAASVNYLDQQGIVQNTGNKRIGFRLNLDSKVSEKLNFGMNIFGSNSNSLNPGGNIQSLLPFIHSTVPYTVPKYEGRYGDDGWTGSGGNNPIALLDNSYQESEFNTFIGTMFGALKILPNLKLTSSATVNNVIVNTKGLQKSFDLWDFTTERITVPRTPDNFRESNNRHRIITLNSILNYNISIQEKHNIALMLGYSQEEELWNTSSAYGQNLIDESIFVLDGPQDQTSFQISGNKIYNNLRSYFGRVNYDFDGKYLFEGSFRYDGSSKFQKNVRWGFFPSISAGWNIHREKFMQNLKNITSLKLRSSIGKVGNNSSLGNYSSISTLALGANYPINGVILPGVYINELANPNLVWESTTTYGMGLDFGFFENKLTGEIDIYKNRTDGILRRIAAPLFGGIPVSPFQNLAIVDAKGYELALSYQNTYQKINYSAGLTLSHTRNKIVSFKDGQFQEINGNTINKVGFPINSIYTYESEGIFRSKEGIEKHATQPREAKIGDLKYKDQLTVDTDGDGKFDAGDGVINADDRKILDPSIPKINLGLNLNFEYKGFDLNLLVIGSMGYKDFVFTAPARPFIYPGRRIVGKEWMDAYNEKTNPDLTTNVPRLDENSGSFIASTYWMHDFSFIRFRTLQVGYTFPAHLIKHIGLTKARIYLNGQNLFTIDKVPHFDPESVGLVYPLTKTVTAGVQLSF